MDEPQPASASEAEALRREASAFFARARRTLRAALALVAVAIGLIVAYAFHYPRVHAYLRGEIDFHGHPRYRPRHPANTSAIDFELVHSRLLPAWTLALARADSPHGRYCADRTFAELDQAIAADRNIRDLLTEAHELLRGDALGNAHRIDYLLWAYNAYLDQQRVPWRLEATLAVREDRSILYAMTYRVLADARAPSGERVRLTQRADSVSTLEGWMGRTPRGDDGSFVQMGRVLHFTVRHVWPAMHPALDERRPAEERSWLPYVREEVEAELDPASIALLRETAVDQQALIEVSAAIESRASCGNRFHIYGLPYNGLTPRNLQAIQTALIFAEDHEDCPEITLDEAARIVGASERLGTTPGLEDALEKLAMVVARSVAAHELRHAADGRDLACPGCSPRVVGAARDEVSGYLAALSTPGLGYLALLQACTTADAANAQSAARVAVLQTILPYGCSGPPHPALYAAAGELEQQLFGARERIEVPAMPVRVPLLPRSEPRPRVARGTALPSGWGYRVGAAQSLLQ